MSRFPTPSGLMIDRVRCTFHPPGGISIHPVFGHVVTGPDSLLVHLLRPLRHTGEDGFLHRLDVHLPGYRGNDAGRDDVCDERLSDLLGDDHLALGGSAARLGTVGLALHRIDIVVDGRRLGEDDPREDQPLAARTGKPDLVSSAHLTPPSPLSVPSGARPSRSRYRKTPEPLSCREPPWETCRRSFREGAFRRPNREAPYPSSIEACPWGSGTCSGARGSWDRR